jgi:hypothetical protein
MAQKALARALDLDPHFASAHLMNAQMTVVGIFNGFSNDGNGLYQAEEELHQAEQMLPGSDGLLLSTQAAVYFAQGRLDRIPLAKMEEQVRKGGMPPTFVVMIYLLRGQTREPLAMLRPWVDSHPVDNVQRMFLGEVLPKLARQGAKFSLIRTVGCKPKGLPNHGSAIYMLMTGHDPGNFSPTGLAVPPSREDLPSVGAVTSRFRPVEPGRPWGPFGPVSPSKPWGPRGPTGPLSPCSPTGPGGPTGPFAPLSPISPTGPVGPEPESGAENRRAARRCLLERCPAGDARPLHRHVVG